MIRPIASALGDLTTSEWHHVADRVRYGDTDHWAWHLSDTDKDALLLERDIGGTVAMMHEHLHGGVVRLLARRLRVQGAVRTAVPDALWGAGRVSALLPDAQRPEGVFRPVLARVPRSPRAWHPDDDVARAKLRLAASGAGVGVGHRAETEAPVGPSEAVEGDAA